MAYRFLLEVPEALADEANVAVEQVADAQVVLARDSHGLGVDDPYVDLTVAAHSLQVIQSLYNWFDQLGASRSDIRIVLHSGERVSLEAVDRAAMVATIRRDQPWVERTIPKVGEHEPQDGAGSFTLGGNLAYAGDQIDAAGANAPEAVALRPLLGEEPATERPVRIEAIDHIAIQTSDLRRAERFYREFLHMDLIGRYRREPQGAFAAVERDYRWDEAIATGRQAEVSLLRNGALTLALHNVGLGTRLGRGTLAHVAVRVDAATFSNLRGAALIRPLTILRNDDTVFSFSDPFGIAWELTIDSTAASLPL